MLFSRRSTFITLIIISITFYGLVTYFLQLQTNAFNENFIAPDSKSYIEAAKMWYGQQEIHAYRPIGYSWIAGLPLLFQPAINTSQLISFNYILNGILWLGTVSLLFLSLSRIITQKLAFCFSLIFVFCLSNIIISTQILTETLSCFLITLMGYCLIKFYSNQKISFFIYAANTAILLSVVRPGVFYFAIFLFLFLVFVLIRRWQSLNKSSLIVTFLSISIIVFSLFKMKSDHGVFTLSLIGPSAAYYYFGSKILAEKQNKDLKTLKNERAEYFKSLSYENQQKTALLTFREFLTNDTSLMLKIYFNNIIENSSNGNTYVFRLDNVQANLIKNVKYMTYVISKIQNIFFVLSTLLIVTIGLFLKNFYNPVWSIFSIFVLYIIAISGISFWQGDRFNLVLYPVVLIFYGISLHLNKRKLPLNIRSLLSFNNSDNSFSDR